MKTPEQPILELEQKSNYWKSKKCAEHLAELSDWKVIIFDVLVDMVKKEYDIQIRKITNPDCRRLQRTKQRNDSFLPVTYSELLDGSIIESRAYKQEIAQKVIVLVLVYQRKVKYIKVNL